MTQRDFSIMFLFDSVTAANIQQKQQMDITDYQSDFSEVVTLKNKTIKEKIFVRFLYIYNQLLNIIMYN